MRRIGKGTNAAFRLFCAFRAGVSALCGTVLGAILGCAAGISLLWPLTVRGGWEEPARVSFETPWTLVVAVVVSIPVLAAVLGAVLARERPHIPAPRRVGPRTRWVDQRAGALLRGPGSPGPRSTGWESAVVPLGSGSGPGSG